MDSKKEYGNEKQDFSMACSSSNTEIEYSLEKDSQRVCNELDSESAPSLLKDSSDLKVTKMDSEWESSNECSSELSDSSLGLLTELEMALPDNPQTWLYCRPGTNTDEIVDLSEWFNFDFNLEISKRQRSVRVEEDNKSGGNDSRTFLRPRKHWTESNPIRTEEEIDQNQRITHSSSGKESLRTAESDVYQSAKLKRKYLDLNCNSSRKEILNISGSNSNRTNLNTTFVKSKHRHSGEKDYTLKSFSSEKKRISTSQGNLSMYPFNMTYAEQTMLHDVPHPSCGYFSNVDDISSPNATDLTIFKNDSLGLSSVTPKSLCMNNNPYCYSPENKTYGGDISPVLSPENFNPVMVSTPSTKKNINDITYDRIPDEDFSSKQRTENSQNTTFTKKCSEADAVWDKKYSKSDPSILDSVEKDTRPNAIFEKQKSETNQMLKEGRISPTVDNEEDVDSTLDSNSSFTVIRSLGDVHTAARQQEESLRAQPHLYRDYHTKGVQKHENRLENCTDVVPIENTSSILQPLWSSKKCNGQESFKEEPNDDPFPRGADRRSSLEKLSIVAPKVRTRMIVPPSKRSSLFNSLSNVGNNNELSKGRTERKSNFRVRRVMSVNNVTVDTTSDSGIIGARSENLIGIDKSQENITSGNLVFPKPSTSRKMVPSPSNINCVKKKQIPNSGDAFELGNPSTQVNQIMQKEDHAMNHVTQKAAYRSRIPTFRPKGQGNWRNGC